MSRHLGFFIKCSFFGLKINENAKICIKYILADYGEKNVLKNSALRGPTPLQQLLISNTIVGSGHCIGMLLGYFLPFLSTNAV